MSELKKRTWHYVNRPEDYEIECDRCHGTNLNWSEYEGLIWCYDCQVDTEGTGGVFDGPIPLKAASILGMSFDRYDMVNNCILRYDENKKDYVVFKDLKDATRS